MIAKASKLRMKVVLESTRKMHVDSKGIEEDENSTIMPSETKSYEMVMPSETKYCKCGRDIICSTKYLMSHSYQLRLKLI